MSKRLIVAGVVTLVLAWSPWITGSNSKNIVAKQFKQNFENVLDGCGLIGIKDSGWIPFGRQVEIEYGCGFRTFDEPEDNRIDTVYVSLLKTPHGVPGMSLR